MLSTKHYISNETMCITSILSIILGLPHFTLVRQPHLLLFPDPCGSPEQYTDTPKAAYRDDSIYYTAQYRGRSAAYPCYKVKLKQTDKSPVERADDGYDKSYTVKHIFPSFPAMRETLHAPVSCQVLLVNGKRRPRLFL